MFKVILTTISATAVIIFFVASFFLNSILGLFNLATIPLSLLPEFYQSKQIVKNLKADKVKLKNNNKALKATNSAHRKKINAIKERHKIKDSNAPKKFAKRSGKKITSSAFAAATIGTVGVIFTVAGLEVHDYCEDKQELLKDENILFDTNKKFDYKICLDEATKDSEKIITLIKESSSEAIKNSWSKTKYISQKQWQQVKEESDYIWQKAKGFNKEQWQNIKTNVDYIWQQTNYSMKEYWQSFKNKYDF